MIYTPQDFKVNKLDIIHNFIEKFDFATLITTQKEELSFSHLPFLFEREQGKRGTLLAHMARANPQWRSFSKTSMVTVLFQGPHAYISPTWYEKDPTNVPTWNYAVVYVRGLARLIDATDRAVSIMEKLIKKHDPHWSLDFKDKRIAEMLNAISVFEIEIESFEAKFKLSQNRSEADRQNVRTKLLASDLVLDRETGRLMPASLERNS